MITVNFHWESRDTTSDRSAYDLIGPTGNLFATVAYNAPAGSYDLHANNGARMLGLNTGSAAEALAATESIVEKVLEGIAL